MEAWREELYHYGTKNMRWGFSKGMRMTGKRMKGMLGRFQQRPTMMDANQTRVNPNVNLGSANLHRPKYQMSDKERAARSVEANYRATAPMVKGVLKGDYGNGAERQKRLGVNYYNVQSQVNKQLTGKNITPKNYANDSSKYRSADWRRTLDAQRAARQAAPGQKTIAKRKAALAAEQSNGRTSSYNKGYAFAQKLFGKKKKKR